MRYRRSRFPLLSSKDTIVVAIDATDGCIRMYDSEAVDGHQIMSGSPFFVMYPAGFSETALLDWFAWDEARAVHKAYTGGDGFGEDAAGAGMPKETTIPPVRRWLQVTRPDGCQLLVKDFALVGATNYSAVGVWPNGVSLYRRCLGRYNPPKDRDRIIHLGPGDLAAGGLASHLEPRDAAEVKAVFEMNRRWLFRLVNGGHSAATGS